jgi:hypothetical protein
VDYLWHILLVKDEAMRNWPIPKTIKELRGFMGLASIRTSLEDLEL